ncbi:copper chaperone CopZ [Metabacillus idriensis]|uniref:copper chaperone CopZ n=1 Tax=Bacillaceae TaxID=186817 RepID=UPI00105979A1|nr:MULTISPECIES: copper chaperone CopZ [Bacillaceae]MDR0139855.1 copper chaperone CopZ [Metabacillus idriensis]TDL78726.1 copper chaperone CopZ [Peribacillus frigoritolerans]
MENVTLNVQGMSCNHCVKAIEGSVGELNGVKSVKVDLNEGTVDVDYNPNEVNVAVIKEAIDDQGYEVE